MEGDTKACLIGCIVGFILLAIVIAGFTWAGVDATREDREWRAKRAQVCETIEDQALRTLCVVKGP